MNEEERVDHLPPIVKCTLLTRLIIGTLMLLTSLPIWNNLQFHFYGTLAALITFGVFIFKSVDGCRLNIKEKMKQDIENRNVTEMVSSPPREST